MLEKNKFTKLSCYMVSQTHVHYTVYICNIFTPHGTHCCMYMHTIKINYVHIQLWHAIINHRNRNMNMLLHKSLTSNTKQ